MLNGKNIAAIVPARSGSKGIPDKNMRLLHGVSLIGHAGQVLSAIEWIDAKVLSTDSPAYVAEGERYGLTAPFLRPPALSADDTSAVATLQHAVAETERHYGRACDIVLVIEPTSPLRTAADLEQAVRTLIATGADSVVTVSRVSAKFHPQKLLHVAAGRLQFATPEGEMIVGRQDLVGDWYWRNGVCYALTRHCLMDRGRIFTEHTVPQVIDRPVVNIDDPIDLAWAEFLYARR